MLTFTLHTMRSANRCLPYEWSIDLMLQRHTRSFLSAWHCLLWEQKHVYMSLLYRNFLRAISLKIVNLYVFTSCNNNEIIIRRGWPRKMQIANYVEEFRELSFISSTLARDVPSWRMHDAKMSRACKFVIKDVTFHQNFKLLPLCSRGFKEIRKKGGEYFIGSNAAVHCKKEALLLLVLYFVLDLYTLVRPYSRVREPGEFQTVPLGRAVVPADL